MSGKTIVPKLHGFCMFLQRNFAVTKVSLGPKISRKNMTMVGPQEIIANHSPASPNLQPSLKAVIWYGIVRIRYGCGTNMAWYGRQCSNEAAKIPWVRLSVLLESTISKHKHQQISTPPLNSRDAERPDRSVHSPVVQNPHHPVPRFPRQNLRSPWWPAVEIFWYANQGHFGKH